MEIKFVFTLIVIHFKRAIHFFTCSKFYFTIFTYFINININLFSFWIIIYISFSKGYFFYISLAKFNFKKSSIAKIFTPRILCYPIIGIIFNSVSNNNNSMSTSTIINFIFFIYYIFAIRIIFKIIKIIINRKTAYYRTICN